MSAADSIADGNWDTEIGSDSRDETGHLIRAIRKMRDSLKTRTEADRRRSASRINWRSSTPCCAGR
ncbi:hypothetical protein ASALC70_00002 [Alcanivorax sp. ALC70]|nr:hypothetical protein ASALC70_00002 [Alcanivorax sp. ALC70]